MTYNLYSKSKKCVICDDVFIPYRSNGKTCSKECRIQYTLNFKKDYYSKTKNTIVKEYRKRNKERIASNRKAQYIKNKESENKKHKEWYQKNKETERVSALIRARKRWNDDPEKMKKYNLILYYKHHEERKLRSREYSQRDDVRSRRLKLGKIYYQKNRKHILAKTKEWHKAHPESHLKAWKKHIRKMEIALELPNKKFAWVLTSWSMSVKKKLGKYCSICGSNDRVNSHHIFFKSLYPKLSLNINNGITLCKEHHNELHSLNPIIRK